MHHGLTEDDTFLKLRKISYDDLIAKLTALPDAQFGDWSDEDTDAWFWSHGWTYHEYAVEYNVRRARNGK